MTLYKHEKFAPSGIRLNVDTNINTLLFVDDQFIIQKYEDDLQKSKFRLHKICQDYGMKISVNKTILLASKGKELFAQKLSL